MRKQLKEISSRNQHKSTAAALKKSSELRKLKKPDLSKASDQEVFNFIAQYMVSNQMRNSARRSDIAKLLDCSFQKANSLLKLFTSQGKLRRDVEIDDLYWLELNSY